MQRSTTKIALVEAIQKRINIVTTKSTNKRIKDYSEYVLTS